MAFIFTTTRPRIANKMAAGDKEVRRWMSFATFAKTANGYWVAWRKDAPSRMAVLPPDHPNGEPCLWLESWDDTPVEEGINYVESGRFEEEEPAELNLRILNEATGKWE